MPSQSNPLLEIHEQNRAARAAYALLRGQFRGDLLRPDDRGYEEARTIWNGMVAQKPGLIARCAEVRDIQTAIRVANGTRIHTAVRCGGHSLAGFSTCDSGLVIDL
ncbi:MAG TPA: FAD-binding protein, partial [Candidatus Udaeobacter sp.]|nr:FAD-binding protein [Candidatus Udaeobacter sp.]